MQLYYQIIFSMMTITLKNPTEIRNKYNLMNNIYFMAKTY